MASVASAKHILQSMGNKNHGDALARKVLISARTFSTSRTAKRAVRFVKNQHLWRKVTATDGDRLALAA
jgi:hypothetical protein